MKPMEEFIRGLKLYSFVDNHDVDRIASQLKVPGHIFPVYTLLYTLPGIPSIYYGSEWGILGRKEGGNDEPLRPAIDIGEALVENADSKILEWVRTLGRILIRNRMPVLTAGIRNCF